MTTVCVGDILRFLDGRPQVPRVDQALTGVKRVDEANDAEITWAHSSAAAMASRAGLLLVRDGIETRHDQNVIWVRDPRLALVRVIHAFFPALKKTNQPSAITGDECVIHTTARFIHAQNYVRHDGPWIPFPSTGDVRLGHRVRVGAYTTIAYGSLGDTLIGDDVVIGQHCNIGHDCRVGVGSMIVCKASLAGWVTVGNDVRINQGVLIRPRVTIGDGAVIGMGAVVVDDVPAGERWWGSPARKEGA